MSEVEEKKRFMVRQWEDLKKSGGVTFSLNQMEQILQGGDGAVLTREEVMSKVISYFNSCVKVVLDEDTQEKVTTWCVIRQNQGLHCVWGLINRHCLTMLKALIQMEKPIVELIPIINGLWQQRILTYYKGHTA